MTAKAAAKATAKAAAAETVGQWARGRGRRRSRAEIGRATREPLECTSETTCEKREWPSNVDDVRHDQRKKAYLRACRHKPSKYCRT